MNFADMAIYHWIKADEWEKKVEARGVTLRAMAEKQVDRRTIPAGLTRNDVLYRVLSNLTDSDKIRDNNIGMQQHHLRKSHAAAAIAAMLGQQPERVEHQEYIKEMTWQK